MSLVYSEKNNKLINQLLENHVIHDDQVEKYSSMDYARLVRLLWQSEDVNQEALARSLANTFLLPYVSADEIATGEEVHYLLGVFDSETSPLLPLHKL
ncbi:MAG: hypothetical protein GWN00_05380, partial [Aliifodinibius sp.]|nr:hypothetical protein [Fodinibius sp.]NIY24260.1 hypothetical protein [Fodinibius sp.]